MENKEGGYKLFKSLENSKIDLEPDSPEYQEQLQNVFSIISEAHASGKAFEVDNGRFDGDAEAGKAAFQTIANSLSATDKENFHFWPQMTEAEKAEEERKNKERINRIGEDPILQSKRIHAVNEITHALNQKPKLINSSLSPENQD
ncbi:14040_t:CDS:1 [Entrophospora sp. SA101]|nr:7026_t:CDS:1 [Entrophospora sp. SA101]CAJ0761763.1 14040_t:CDS:1 [Entrophospora sp. SA101]CAJ0831365.1 22572_t:CDS:1 [Entrophospora sp. SA101]CAJ0894499.1 5732_t:CDS:1 [Entrophospora sp. SA101]